MRKIAGFSTAVTKTAKLGATDIIHLIATVSKWNTQRSACVFHFSHRGAKNQEA